MRLTARRQKRRRMPRIKPSSTCCSAPCSLQAATPTRLDIIHNTLSAEYNNTNRNTPGLLPIYEPPRDCPAWCFPRSSAFLSQRSVSPPLSHTQYFLSMRAHTNHHPVCPRLHLPPLSHRTHLPHPPLQQGHRPLWNPRAVYRLRAQRAPAQPLHLLSHNPRPDLMALLRHQAA